MPLHPLKTTIHIRNNYIKYLKTIKPFQDEWLRKEFARAIKEPEMLVKGPLVEISPPFETEVGIRGLVEEGVLSPLFQQLCTLDHLPYERPLYQHQITAVRKLVSGRNVVVSTGTGSGKTETFLLPILNYLLREKEQGTLDKPGVRALLLYPMNALANDQVKRLRGLLAKYPHITFGRYVGETKHTKGKAEDYFEKNYPGEPRVKNELLSRAEMQETPPHILLTNYAMLEYLLLRPKDSKLFDGATGQHWKFIVLDEAHVYNGANATEIAMLLRRVQDRVVQSELGRLQVVATSATLGGGKDDFPAVVDFASNLFSHSFEWVEDDPTRQDVVEAVRVDAGTLGDTWGNGSPALYRGLHKLAENQQNRESDLLPQALLARLTKIALSHKIPRDVVEEAAQSARQDPNRAMARFLYRLLRGDENIRHIQGKLQSNPEFLKEISPEIFPDADDSEQALIDLVALAILARPNKNDMPLLPARYHVFARALEGAFVCLNRAAHSENTPSLFLHRHKFCPECKSRVFELANCTRCGTAYLIGDEEYGENLNEAPGEHFKIEDRRTYLTQNSAVYLSLQAKQMSYYVIETELSVPDDDELVASDEEIDDSVQDDTELEEFLLCPQCGQIRSAFIAQKCGCKMAPIKLSKVDIGRKRTLRRCVSCSTRSSGGVVYRFLTGQDAPVSVLASALYQCLPPAKDDESARYPGEGRKLLNFTDSRQKAAFFAPYFERVHHRNMRRRLIMKTVLESPDTARGDLRLRDLLPRVLNQAVQTGVFDQEQSRDERERTIAIWLMQEFSPLDQRISLEGLGLLRFRLVHPRNWSPPDLLTAAPWNLTSDQAFDLITLLLNTLRRQGAITYLLREKVDLVQDDAFAPRQKAFYFRESESHPKKGIFGWMPAEQHSNARLDLLKRYLARQEMPVREIQTLALRTLREIWLYLSGPGSPWETHLPRESHRGHGYLYQIAHKMWEVIPSIDGDVRGWYICNRCHNISPISLGSICTTYSCSGSLEPLDQHKDILDMNLYRDIYLHGDPIPMRAEEHTAQWTPQAAADVQNRFIRGEINALSCSTTFELGVDVGDLQAVVMRNVPPTTANYVQRAGRAGRRTDSAAFALTFAQRRSHDLNYYNHPKSMVKGEIKPPVTVLTNEKIIRRHLHSIVFGAFFRWAVEKHKQTYKTIGEFFAPEGGTSAPELLAEFLETKPPTLQQALQRVVPKDLHKIIGIDVWLWKSALFNADEKGTLDKARLTLTSELEEFAQLEDEAAGKRKYKQAGYFASVQKQIRGRQLIGFLATYNVLPKYGFPTDVVELKTDHLTIRNANRIELNRDLRMAISEFAPGSEVVAAKVVWRSQGIRKLPNRAWEPFKYVVCGECHRFHYAISEPPTLCQGCGNLLSDHPEMRGNFIVPEHGFIAGNKTRSPGETPPERIYASRVFFADYRLPDSDELIDESEELDQRVSSSNVQVYKRYSRHGWLAVVNNGWGRGFRICGFCGYAEPIPLTSTRMKGTHNNPLNGESCKGAFHTYHLGHRFMTDVLELRTTLPASGKTHTYSLLYALLDGASEALGISRNDIEGTVYPRGQSPSLVLYDNVPGGAGHVLRIYENLRPAFEAAHNRLDQCECGEETSCYNCLRNYRNQYFHDELQRGSALRSLRILLGEH